MDPEVIQRGRSYDGVGFICKKQNNISYRNVNVDSDRVSDQIALYAETIDIVQNVLEIHSQCSPLMLMV